MIRQEQSIYRGHSGFTLVELMIVIGIIGILGVVAYPMVVASLPGYRLRAEMHEMVINFKRAKLEAVKSNRNVVLAFVPEREHLPGSYQVFVDNNNNGVFDRQIDRNLVIQPMRTNVVLACSGFPADRTRYNPRGMANPGNVEIRQDDDSKRYRLVLSSTGAVRVETTLASSGAK